MASTLSGLIGSLRVNLSLDSASLRRGLDNARNNLKGFGSSFKGTMLAVGKFAKTAFIAIAAAAAAAFAAISAGVMNLSAEAKEINQMSKAFGMSAKSYQGLVLGAKKYGIEQDKVNDVIKDSNEKLGEYIATGGGGFKDFMEQIAKPKGVSAEELINLPPEERFVKMQSMMEDMNLPLEMQSFYWESIASDATYLIPLLSNGGAEAKRLTAEFERMGLILSDDVIKNLTNFRTNMGTIGQTMKGWGNILISEFAPQLDAITAKFANFITTSDGIRSAFQMAGQVIAWVLDAISNGASLAYSWFANLNTEGGRLGSIMQSLGTIWAAVMTAFQAWWPFIQNLFGLWFDYLYMLGDNTLTVFDYILQVIAAIAQPVANIAVGMYNAFNDAITWIRDAFQALPDNASYAFELMMAYGTGAANAIVDAFRALPGAMGDLMYAAANAVVKAIAEMVDGAINSIKTALDTVSDYTGWTIESSNLAENWKIDNPYSGQAGNIGKDFGETFSAEANKVIRKRAVKGFIDDAAGYLKGLGDKLPFGKGKSAETVPGTAPIGVTPPTKPTTLPTLPGGGGGGGGGGKGDDKTAQEAKDQAKAYEDLQLRVKNLGETWHMTALQKKIYDEQQKIGNAASAETVENLIRQEDRLEQFKQKMQEVENSFVSNFEGMLTGSKSFKDALGGFLSDIASMLARSALSSLWAGSGISGFIGGIMGFSSGGYTGDGGKHEPAGIVHKGEYVFSKESVDKLGLGFLSRLHNGGLGSAMTSQTSSQGSNRVRATSAGVGMANSIRNGGGITRVIIGYDKDTEARVLENANNNSVKIVKQGISQYDKTALPNRISQYEGDRRRRG